MGESTNTASFSARSSNVLSFPKKNIRLVFPVEDDAAREATKRAYVDEVTEAYAQHIVHKLAQQGFDIFIKDFDKHFGFTIEALRSTMLMTMELHHPFQEVVEQTVQMVTHIESIDDDSDPA